MDFTYDLTTIRSKPLRVQKSFFYYKYLNFLLHLIISHNESSSSSSRSRRHLDNLCCSSRPSGGCGCGGGRGGGGGYGGCKHKARGVLKLDGDSPIDDDFGEIYGLSIRESSKPPANVSLQQAHDPNFHFSTCCAERGLSPACRARCNYQTYNQDLLQKMLTGADVCPLDSLPEMHFCAAQGRDHSSCCRAKEVDSTVAGDKCLVFCNQIPDKYTPIDYTYAACFGKFDEMKQCFHSTIAAKAKSYFRNH